MYKPTPLGIARPSTSTAAPVRPRSQQWPRLWSPNPAPAVRPLSRRWPAWAVWGAVVGAVGLVVVVEFGPDLVAHFIWGG